MRYVFENAVELASVSADVSDPKPVLEELPQAAGTASQAASEPVLQIEASGQDILTALYSVAEYQGNEVATICRSTQNRHRLHITVPALCCYGIACIWGRLSNVEVLWALDVCLCLHEFSTSTRTELRVILRHQPCAWMAGLMRTKWQHHYRSLERCRQQLLSSEGASWMLILVSLAWGNLTCSTSQTGNSIAA